MERNVNTGKGDGSETALELDVALELLLLLGPFVRAVDDVAQHLLHLLDRKLFGQLTRERMSAIGTRIEEDKDTNLCNVDLLRLQGVQNDRQRLEGDELSSANVLLPL